MHQSIIANSPDFSHFPKDIIEKCKGGEPTFLLWPSSGNADGENKKMPNRFRIEELVYHGNTNTIALGLKDSKDNDLTLVANTFTDAQVHSLARAKESGKTVFIDNCTCCGNTDVHEELNPAHLKNLPSELLLSIAESVPFQVISSLNIGHPLRTVLNNVAHFRKYLSSRLRNNDIQGINEHLCSLRKNDEKNPSTPEEISGVLNIYENMNPDLYGKVLGKLGKNSEDYVISKPDVSNVLRMRLGEGLENWHVLLPENKNEWYDIQLEGGDHERSISAMNRKLKNNNVSLRLCCTNMPSLSSFAYLVNLYAYAATL